MLGSSVRVYGLPSAIAVQRDLHDRRYQRPPSVEPSERLRPTGGAEIYSAGPNTERRMPTAKQTLGDFGEKAIVKNCACPKCKRSRTLKQLPPNFKCADLVCDFCGYIAQVKTKSTTDVDSLPKSVLGAAWQPQQERMKAGIYFPLFLVLRDETANKTAVYYLSADLQTPAMFQPRKPLSSSAKRAGWQGFLINVAMVDSLFVRLE